MSALPCEAFQQGAQTWSEEQGWGWGGVGCNLPGKGLGRAPHANHAGQRRYLVLVELVHGLCDSIAVIHPHDPGKPGDEASIA